MHLKITTVSWSELSIILDDKLKNNYKTLRRYGFPSDPIVDYYIRLIYATLNIMWNHLQWRLYFFMNDFLDVCLPRVPWRPIWKLMCCFLIVRTPAMACKGLDVAFEWGLYIDMYYGQKFLFDQQTLLKSSWYFPKKDFKPQICIRPWRGTQE